MKTQVEIEASLRNTIKRAKQVEEAARQRTALQGIAEGGQTERRAGQLEGRQEFTGAGSNPPRR